MISRLITVLIMLSAVSSCFSQSVDSLKARPTWQISLSGYFQVMTSSAEQSFDLPFSKLFIDGVRFVDSMRVDSTRQDQSKKLFWHLEFRPTSGNLLLKAYFGYSFSSLATVIIGQLSNPIKHIEPQPEEKLFVHYILYQQYVVNSDGIGLAVYGKFNSFSYYGCLVNGAGRNVPDSNQFKDLAVDVAYTPWSILKFEIAGQTGQQPAGSRQAGFILCALTPWSSLEIQLASMGRTDLDNFGWYVSTAYSLPSISFHSRVHRTKRQDDPEWTGGIQVGNKPLKLQADVITGHKRHPEIAVVVQMFIE